MELAERSSDTTKENPWPLGFYSRNFHQYISRAPGAWIEGEIVSLKRYPRGAYLKLKDLNDEAFLPASSFVPEILEKLDSLKEGTHVVFYAKPDFWVKRGEISMTLQDIAEVGVGDMLARIELLKKKLADEGLFAEVHKQTLPYFPRKIGLICGKNAQAKDDVMQNAKRRWPDIQFTVREVSVGNSPATPREVMNALAELDAMEDIDIIVITRGGGALEEVVIPFSDEALIRAVFECSTPLVSAIGHETDMPLLDFVADFRASTPTDAAKNIVPSVNDEFDIVSQLAMNMRASVKNRLDLHIQQIDAYLSRPILTKPEALLVPHFNALNESRTALNQGFQRILHSKIADFESLSAKLNVLSPRQVLSRGYAIPMINGNAIKDLQKVSVGDELKLTLTDGELVSEVKEIQKMAQKEV